MSANKNESIDFIKSKWLKIIISILSVFFASVYMPFLVFSVNSDEVSFSESLFPIVFFALIGLSIFGLMLFFTKSASKSEIASILMILMLENYVFIEKIIKTIIPSLKYWHIVVILIIVVLHIAYFIYKFLREDIALIISCVFGGMFAVLVILNLITAIPNMIFTNDINVADTQNVDQSDTVTQNDGSNIYYFVLDEAASFETLSDYYDFDAVEFKNFLQDNNFNISEKSYNENIFTTYVLTNILNLDYVVDTSIKETELKNYRKDYLLKNILEKNNYNMLGIGATEFLGIASETTSGNTGATTVSGETFLQLIMGKTFLYPFYQTNTDSAVKTIHDTFNYFDNCDYNEKSKFRFIYLSCPHQPFLFDEDGNLTSSLNHANWDDESYYLGQYKFIMKKMQITVETIIENDPQSIIVISSDHGPRYNPEIPSSEQKHVLNCVYFKGETLPYINGKNGVNTLRFIFEKQFHEDLPEVLMP